MLRSHDNNNKYSEVSVDAPVYASNIDEKTAKSIAATANDVYQYSWNMIIKGKFDDDMSHIPHVDGNYATITDFSALRTTRNVIDYGGVFVGPEQIVHETYVEKNGDTYNAFVCEKQNSNDVRRISVAGNADSVSGYNGWRIIVSDDGKTVRGAYEDSRMCGKK